MGTARGWIPFDLTCAQEIPITNALFWKGISLAVNFQHFSLTFATFAKCDSVLNFFCYTFCLTGLIFVNMWYAVITVDINKDLPVESWCELIFKLYISGVHQLCFSGSGLISHLMQ